MDFLAEQLSSTGRQLMERRQFLADAATGLGSIALASLLCRDGLLAASVASYRSGSTPCAAFTALSPEGKERRRHFLRRRREPTGNVGLQAGADQARWPAIGRRPRRDISGTRGKSCPTAIRIPPARRDRQDGFRHAPASRGVDR